jgi:hypothetical protein
MRQDAWERLVAGASAAGVSRSEFVRGALEAALGRVGSDGLCGDEDGRVSPARLESDGSVPVSPRAPAPVSRRPSLADTWAR